MTEEQYKQEAIEAGVDIPELKDNPEPEAPEAEEKPVEETPKVEPSKEEPEAPKDELPEPREKRSIYDEYKDKKVELKSEREAREQAERERDELKAKLEEISKASTPADKQEAEEDAIAYAKKVGADPDLVQRIIADARKGFEPQATGLSDADRALLEEARLAKEAQMFEAEFKTVTPTLKEFFPTATEAEIEAIKKELDDISHTKDWADKSLDYIVFKQKDKLATFVSPKKRGIEPKAPKDAPPSESDFDPTADLSKMTPEQREAWYAKYQEIGKSEGLASDGQGRKIII